MATELLNKFRCCFTRPRHLVGGTLGRSESRERDHKLDVACYRPMTPLYVDKNMSQCLRNISASSIAPSRDGRSTLEILPASVLTGVSSIYWVTMIEAKANFQYK